MLNMNFNERVLLQSTDLVWVESPMPGISRKLLERDGGELARATSIVRYTAGSHFSTHHHTMGEEIFVLEGIFSDEYGDYPAGTYIKNPPGTSHAPYSATGCILFVKLRHLNADDQLRVVIHTGEMPWYPGMVSGLQVMPLSEYATQHTALVRWAPGTIFKPHQHWGGEEVLVLDGVFSDQYGDYRQGSWIRSPHLSAHHPFSKTGCTILVKTGHLPT